ncbi:hypothetical protein MUK72_19890 (plasmid) [Halococcus dombrowskii]|uniref:Uncharacterized protein n=1 Tax=Halococcus dombrowskii TaxID=179637 RepID=A0AAV3SJT1_HALDO|nr:hypothetical protein [Halococcus dombrowskii]UOO97599.1 hypothetical protein MUK72_19890 [Halococcus dombrowskii]
MSVIPEEWVGLDSTAGLLYELGWLLLMFVVLGGLLVLQPFFFDVKITPIRLSGSILLGVVLGVLLVVSTMSDRIRRFWETYEYRFGALLVFSLLFQAVLRLVPTWTLLTGITISIVAVPGRIAIYLQARAE